MEEQNYTYSSATEMFRSVLGAEKVQSVKPKANVKQDRAITDFIRKFSAVCVSSAGGLMMFEK